MYIPPKPHKCDRCGHEAEVSPHRASVAPIIYGDIFCPKCFEDFIRKHCGVMKPLPRTTTPQ